ncbi:hypothetical protein GT045_25640 [Streptomyces sp. SID486]|uniref:hypothetical protein n=1 Tax=Streptomyces sp. SID486 TaxID=2690264 RepID=UPI00136E5000|nr:hypothetical protein [Streptomyces sp. SID486]MYX98104.1 hypothetical protein [Streptomyces sp. SID486]
MTVRGWCRATRAGVFAAVCVLLAALGHVTMSGTPVPWWPMAAAAAGTGTAGWLLAGRERGRAPIVAVVITAQGVLHETFALAQGFTSRPASGPGALPGAGVLPSAGAGAGAGASRDMSVTGTGSMRAMDLGSMGGGDIGSMGGIDTGSMGGMHMGSLGSMGGMRMEHTAHVAHGMGDMSGTASVGMLVAHLLAAALCGLWLAHGERGVFRVLRAAAAWMLAPLLLLLALPTPFARPAVDRSRAAAGPAPVRLLLGCSLTFRGPPTGAAVV